MGYDTFFLIKSLLGELDDSSLAIFFFHNRRTVDLDAIIADLQEKLAKLREENGSIVSDDPTDPEQIMPIDPTLPRNLRRQLERDYNQALKHKESCEATADRFFEQQSMWIDRLLLSDAQKSFLQADLRTRLNEQLMTYDLNMIRGFPVELISVLNDINEETKRLIREQERLQRLAEQNLFSPSSLSDFVQTDAMIVQTGELEDGSPALCTVYEGYLTNPLPEVCPHCGARLISNGVNHVGQLVHTPNRGMPSKIVYHAQARKCPKKGCRFTCQQRPTFKDAHHRITPQLKDYVFQLLAYGFNLKDTAEITGLNKNTVKDLDKERLMGKYTVDGEGKELIQPEEPATYLAIDEFKLHNNRVYATVIINLTNGHALWLAKGKGKDTITSFIDHVGLDWMKNVQAVACDMNANFADTFTEACPHIRIVYDHFHIVKNFNEKVVSEVRKDEYRRLMDEGRTAEAQKLKRSRFILTASRKTLAKRDKEAKEGKAYGRNSKLFNLQSKPKKDGNLIKYEALLEENKLFFTCDIIKDYLDRAYKDTGEIWKNRLMMGKYLHAIMRHCRASQNKHMIWFAKLIDDHYKGIISYATFPIASGKIEGINQKIKTVRREGYGYPDDEYFFLKIMDFTRKEYVRNPKSHILSRDVLKAIDLHNAQKEALQETGAA